MKIKTGLILAGLALQLSPAASARPSNLGARLVLAATDGGGNGAIDDGNEIYNPSGGGLPKAAPAGNEEGANADG